MAYDEHLAERTRACLQERKVRFEEKAMMGGLTFMVNEKMCLGILKNELMVRIHPDDTGQALKVKGARIMDFTKTPMKGYILAGGEAIDKDITLEKWVDMALAYNPLARSSKKKK